LRFPQNKGAEVDYSKLGRALPIPMDARRFKILAVKMAYAQIGSFVLFKFTCTGFSDDLAVTRSDFATEATFIICIFECLAFVM